VLVRQLVACSARACSLVLKKRVVEDLLDMEQAVYAWKNQLVWPWGEFVRTPVQARVGAGLRGEHVVVALRVPDEVDFLSTLGQEE
jgi:hypothetical protein